MVLNGHVGYDWQLVSGGVVCAADLGTDATTIADLVAVLACPRPDSAEVARTARLATRCLLTVLAPGRLSCLDEGTQRLLHRGNVLPAQVDGVVLPIQGERDGSFSLAAVNVVDKASESLRGHRLAPLRALSGTPASNEVCQRSDNGSAPLSRTLARTNDARFKPRVSQMKNELARRSGEYRHLPVFA